MSDCMSDIISEQDADGNYTVTEHVMPDGRCNIIEYQMVKGSNPYHPKEDWPIFRGYEQFQVSGREWLDHLHECLFWAAVMHPERVHWPAGGEMDILVKEARSKLAGKVE
jgi:hypothetical protein